MEQGIGKLPSDVKGWEMTLLCTCKLSKEQPQPNPRRAAGAYLTPGQSSCRRSLSLARFRCCHLQHNHHLQRGLGDLQPTRGHSIKPSDNL